MTVNERKLLTKLALKYGDNITLKELINMKDITPIEEVKFDIHGVYVYAYECTGQTADWSGTIREILAELTRYEYSPSDKGALLGDVITEAQLSDLANFFIGKRYEDHVDHIKVDMSREVTLDEIKSYLKTLEVKPDFDYTDTLIKF